RPGQVEAVLRLAERLAEVQVGGGVVGGVSAEEDDGVDLALGELLRRQADACVGAALHRLEGGRVTDGAVGVAERVVEGEGDRLALGGLGASDDDQRAATAPLEELLGERIGHLRIEITALSDAGGKLEAALLERRGQVPKEGARLAGSDAE